jgi:hypothetical protein
MRISYHCTLYNSRMHIDGILYFRRTDAVAAYIQYVIHPARDPVITFSIPQRPVTREIQPGIGGKIGLATTFMISIGRPDDGRPGKFDTKIAADIIALQLFALLIYQ